MSIGASEEYVLPAVIGTLTFLGVTSTLFFAIDGFVTAGEADRVTTAATEPRLQLAPALGAARAANERLLPTVGLTGRF